MAGNAVAKQRASEPGTQRNLKFQIRAGVCDQRMEMGNRVRKTCGSVGELRRLSVDGMGIQLLIKTRGTAKHRKRQFARREGSLLAG